MNMFEIMLERRLQKIDKFPYEDICIIDKYPLYISKKVLKVLIENACLGRNYGPIELAQKK